MSLGAGNPDSPDGEESRYLCETLPPSNLRQREACHKPWLAVHGGLGTGDWLVSTLSRAPRQPLPSLSRVRLRVADHLQEPGPPLYPHLCM